jgi:hypothetical protein
MPKNKKYRNLKVVFENAPFKKNIEFHSYTGPRNLFIRDVIAPKLLKFGYYWGRSQIGNHKYPSSKRDILDYVANGQIKENEMIQYFHTNEASQMKTLPVTNATTIVLRVINLHFSRTRKRKDV